MKPVFGILIVVGLIFGVWKIWDYWEKVNKEKADALAAVTTVDDSSSYSGMPDTLDDSYRKVRDQGPDALRRWLETYRHLIQDPRLAAIELDYVVAITRENPVQAKKIFQEVKGRIAPTEPLYKRIQALEKTYE